MEQNFFANDENVVVDSRRVIYTPSSFARSSLLYIQEIGTLTAIKPHVSSRRGLSSYLFFKVQAGSGTLVYENKSYTLSEGDCVFIDCRNKYSHATSESDLWTLSWIHFSGISMGGVYAKYIERGGTPVIHPENTTAYDLVYKELELAASSEDHLRDMHINEKLSSLLTLLMQQSWNPDTADVARRKRDLEPVREYLEQHFVEKINLDELADRFFINKFYLTKLFKEQFGMSITSYLLIVRVTRAKQMLRFTDETAESIGIRCGLGALTYFSRTFKKLEGVSPREYRDSWQEKKRD